MGPLDQLMGMIPGGGKAVKGMQLDESAFTQVEAIINSMTHQERIQPKILNGSRRKRIARGSGTTVQDVNQLVKQFQMMQKNDQADGPRQRRPLKNKNAPCGLGIPRQGE